MRCAVLRTPGGPAIVCGRGPLRVAKCAVCGSPAQFQCDHPAPSRQSRTCDRWLCDRCRVRQSRGVDFCPEHARQLPLPGL